MSAKIQNFLMCPLLLNHYSDKWLTVFYIYYTSRNVNYSFVLFHFNQHIRVFPEIEYFISSWVFLISTCIPLYAFFTTSHDLFKYFKLSLSLLNLKLSSGTAAWIFSLPLYFKFLQCPTVKNVLYNEYGVFSNYK